MESTNTGYTLTCIQCGRENSEEETSTYCTTCGGVLEVHYNEPSPHIQYPLKKALPDPLKTGPSSLVRLNRLSEIYDAELYAKLEFEHPTGCFKDRGSYIEVQKALELGRDAICLASTGNMAASVAAYACYFKLPCFVFVPEKTPDSKIAQATIYDANIIRIKGDFSTCERLCQKFAKSGNYYLAGDYVFRQEGQKSFTYEVESQSDINFDYVLIPVGAGTNFAAIYKGYKEMEAAGQLTHIPKFVAVQPKESSPVVEGIFKREKVVKDMVNTMADAVAVADPFDFYKVLKGIDETDGKAYTVTENEILASLKEMAIQEGHFTETACALPLAAIKNDPETFRGKRCLLVLTGTGLKNAHIVAKHSLSSPVLNADLDQVQSYINSGYIDMQKDAWGKARDNMITNLKLDPSQKEMYESYVQKMSKRGKSLSPAEIEYLQSLVFNEEAELEYPVVVDDYKVTMRKEGLVEAKVQLTHDGKTVITQSNGVGPIDSLLGAVKKETDDFIHLQIMNHQVEILSPDTESLVVVTLELKFQEEIWTVKSASPDTLEAALEAFIKGIAIANRKMMVAE